jgi:hypothetical protein
MLQRMARGVRLSASRYTVNTSAQIRALVSKGAIAHRRTPRLHYWQLLPFGHALIAGKGKATRVPEFD